MVASKGHPPTFTGFTTEQIKTKFWDKVKKSSRCWTWLGKLNGHRQVAYYRGRCAARFVWEMEKGPIPKKLAVLHTCDNPKCVRPKHLYLGTYGDNARDRWNRSSQAARRRHRAAILAVRKQISEGVRRSYRYPTTRRLRHLKRRDASGRFKAA
jgi:hypothetical protein